MAGLLIPSSNADSERDFERDFSMLRKIHSDEQSNLHHSTIVSLITLKFNCDTCFHDTKFTPYLLSTYK